MKLTEQEKREFDEVLDAYLQSPRVQQMKKYTQHGCVSTFEHCYMVAETAMWINRHFDLGADEDILLPAALMHDMFLYDWHGHKNKYHAVSHATLASRNAVRYCDANEDIRFAIDCHMWPISPKKFPRTKESAILCVADKYCSLIETVAKRKRKYNK